MSNTPSGSIVVAPRAGNISLSENVTEVEVAALHPNGEQGLPKIRTSNDRSSTADAEMADFMLNIDPESLTSGLERDLAKLNDKLADFSGYDKEGQPIYRYTGKERELLAYQYANRRDSLAQARKTRAQAEQMQAQAKKTRAATSQRIEAAAQVQAQKLIEEEEIAKRARQIAARAGVEK